MTGVARRQVIEFLLAGRTWLYSIVVPTVVGAVITVTSGGMQVDLFLIWTLFFLLVISIYEGFLRARHIEDQGVVWGGTVNAVHKALPQSLAEMIRDAGSTGVTILGGTLGGFAPIRANTEALGQLHRDGIPVRILLLDPDSLGLERLADQRHQVGSSVSAAELKAEIRKSLKHLHDHLGRVGMHQCCRLFAHTPRNSIYRLGDNYLVTVYRFGGGGSSPTLSLTRNAQNAEFCSGLDRGFEDLWNAQSTRGFRDEDIL